MLRIILERLSHLLHSVSTRLLAIFTKKPATSDLAMSRDFLDEAELDFDIIQKRKFISPDAFRLESTYDTRPGLGTEVEQLMREGRYRSALDLLFSVLDQSPSDQEALFLAAIVVGASRTQQITAIEPLGNRYQYDRRLDPLWVV